VLAALTNLLDNDIIHQGTQVLALLFFFLRVSGCVDDQIGGWDGRALSSDIVILDPSNGVLLFPPSVSSLTPQASGSVQNMSRAALRLNILAYLYLRRTSLSFTARNSTSAYNAPQRNAALLVPATLNEAHVIRNA
jgi:hypothetical protein